MHLLPLWAFVACSRENFTFTCILRNLIKGVLGKLLIRKTESKERITEQKAVTTFDLFFLGIPQLLHTDNIVRTRNITLIWKNAKGEKGVSYLGTFAKLRKETTSFVMSARLYVRMEQLGSH